MISIKDIKNLHCLILVDKGTIFLSNFTLSEELWSLNFIFKIIEGNLTIAQVEIANKSIICFIMAFKSNLVLENINFSNNKHDENEWPFFYFEGNNEFRNQLIISNINFTNNIFSSQGFLTMGANMKIHLNAILIKENDNITFIFVAIDYSEIVFSANFIIENNFISKINKFSLYFKCFIKGSTLLSFENIMNSNFSFDCNFLSKSNKIFYANLIFFHYFFSNESYPMHGFVFEKNIEFIDNILILDKCNLFFFKKTFI